MSCTEKGEKQKTLGILFLLTDKTVFLWPLLLFSFPSIFLPLKPPRVYSLCWPLFAYVCWYFLVASSSSANLGYVSWKQSTGNSPPSGSSALCVPRWFAFFLLCSLLMFVLYIVSRVFSCTWREKWEKVDLLFPSWNQKSRITYFFSNLLFISLLLLCESNFRKEGSSEGGEAGKPVKSCFNHQLRDDVDLHEFISSGNGTEHMFLLT